MLILYLKWSKDMPSKYNIKENQPTKDNPLILKSKHIKLIYILLYLLCLLTVIMINAVIKYYFNFDSLKRKKKYRW